MQSSGNALLLVILVLVWCTSSGRGQSQLPPPCDSLIYCHGSLLKTVQLAELNKDSKYFVDMSLKQSPEVTYAAFQNMMQETGNNASKTRVAEFVSQHFNEPGNEFEAWQPDDWIENPEFLSNVSDPQFRSWASILNGLWKMLGRRISTAVRDRPDQYSQLYVDHPVIVPGGRFREFYYWDSYWTIDGLLLSDMTTTVRGMLENFMQMVEQYGMVPNGGRVYYTRRSQPPYLIPMVKLYIDHTNDMDFVRENIDIMEKELNFWLNNRTTTVSYKGKSYNVAQYKSMVDEPRPESYREDYKVASSLPADLQTHLYIEYKSGAESGWDYSSRWFVNGDSNKGTLKDLHVTAIAPVDLNSLLCYNAKIISDYYEQLGNSSKAAEYKEIHEEKLATLSELFWDETDGIWYDVNIMDMTKRRFFYLSNIHPLWSGSFDQASASVIVARVIDYLKKQGVLDYSSGVPTSTVNTGEQWDKPNAWAPLQHLIVMALKDHSSLHAEAGEIAYQLAEKWIYSAWKGYIDVNAMFEKYNVNLIGAPGGGGEYDVQLGFGWTNGVAMRFLAEFGDKLVSEENVSGSQNIGANWVMVCYLLLCLAAIANAW